MFWYTLKRLALLVPSILLISLVAFGLKQCSIGGDIALELTDLAQVGSAQERARVYEQEYRRLLKKREAHLPVFYFAISTQANSDTLHRIIPIELRTKLATLAGRYGNWTTVNNYANSLNELQTSLWANTPTVRTDNWIRLESEMQILQQANTLTDIQQQIEKLDAQLALLDSPKKKLETALQTTRQAATEIDTKATPWRRYLPALHYYGTDSQYHHWLMRLLRFDFGLSKRTQEPVSKRVRTALGWTLRINGLAIGLAFLLAIPIGVYSAVYTNNRGVQLGNLFLFLLYALPSFWVATLLGKFLTTPQYLDWFPPYGLGQVPDGADWWTALSIRIPYLVLPVFCMTYANLAFITRQIRRSMLSILQSNYIRTARAKGLNQRQIIWQHAFRNGLFPLITIFANVLPAAITGAVIIEYIFSIPGMGWLTLQSIRAGDWPVVYVLLLLLAVATVTGILLADLLYAWADPRVRLGTLKNEGN